MSREFSIATKDDFQDVLKLYKSQIGTEFCAWDEHYPTEQEIEFDLSRDALFVIKDGAKIIGTISIDLDKAVEALDCWSDEMVPRGELSRLCVHKDYQNQGIAKELLLGAMDELRKRNYKSVHFLVNKDNIKALRAYRHLEFNEVGNCYLYEQDFICFEKEL